MHPSWSKAPVSWNFLLDLLSASGFGRGFRLTCGRNSKVRGKKLKHSVVGRHTAWLLLGCKALCDMQESYPLHAVFRNRFAGHDLLGAGRRQVRWGSN